MQDCDFVVSGYSGTNYIIRVAALPTVGVTEIVQNSDNSTCYFGGNGLNIAFYLAQLGLKARPIIRGGMDSDFLNYRDFLEENHILADAFSLVGGDTTPVCYLIEDAAGNHMTLFYKGAMDGGHAPEQYPDEWFAGAKFALLTVASEQDNRCFLRAAQKNHIPVAFAMRADPDAFPDAFLREILHASSIVFMNEAERAYILETLGLTPQDILLQGETDTVVVTLGSKGSLVYTVQDGKLREEGVPVTPSDAVVDATGAGDSFLAGYLYARTKGYAPAECAAVGSTMASFIIEKTGCLTNVPTQAQLLERHRQRHQDV